MASSRWLSYHSNVVLGSAATTQGGLESPLQATVRQGWYGSGIWFLLVSRHAGKPHSMLGPQRPHKHNDPTDHSFWCPPYIWQEREISVGSYIHTLKTQPRRISATVPVGAKKRYQGPKK